jgi:hypothetical protein
MITRQAPGSYKRSRSEKGTDFSGPNPQSSNPSESFTVDRAVCPLFRGMSRGFAQIELPRLHLREPA